MKPLASPPHRRNLPVAKLAPSRPTVPREEVLNSHRERFGFWMFIVFLLHLFVFVVLIIAAWLMPAQKSPAVAINWLNVGDIVQGKPGLDTAPKRSSQEAVPRTSEHPHAESQVTEPVKPSQSHPTPSIPPQPPVAVITPPKVTRSITPPDAPPLEAVHPILPAPPKAIKPIKVRPKVKVDLNEVEVPVEIKPSEKPREKVQKTAAPATKPRAKVDITHDTEVAVPAPVKPTQPKKHDKPAVTTAASAMGPEATTQGHGLSKEEVARTLGESLNHAGVTQAHTVSIGPSGSTSGTQNNFSEFYTVLRDQVLESWQEPPITCSSRPTVQIHVEKDGSVPPGSVFLLHSSGNAVYDESAMSAARSLRKLRQPLPEGCPPDITIDFTLNP